MFSLLNKGQAKANGFNVKKSADSYAGMSFAFACQPERDGIYNLSDYEKERIVNYRVEELIKQNKLLVLPLPAFPSGDVGTVNTDFTHGFAVTASGKKKDLAACFAMFSQGIQGQRILNKYYGGIPTNIKAQQEDFWKKGTLSGVNADNVLIGIEHDERDDFFDAFYDSQNMYEEVLRTRASFSAVLYNKFESIKKGNENGISDEAIKQLELLEKRISLTMQLAERD